MTYIQMLKEKYNLVCGDESSAKDIFEKIERVEKVSISSHYGENKEGKITFFYPQVLCEKILKDTYVLNLTGSEKDNLLYKDGVYKKCSELRDEINKNINYMDPKPDKNRIDTLKEIREVGYKNKDKVNKKTNLINFKNGMYDINIKEILPHSPFYYSTIQVNAELKPKNHDNIDETLFGHLINKSLNDDTRIIMQEIFGYALCNSLQAQKFFVFTGKAKNGKSQVLNVLKNLFDSEFISSLELKHFQDDVKIYNIYNKQLNICADISSEYIEDDSILKRATGEDTINCNPKYRDGINFENKAKLIFSCNELPNVADKTQGFMRRLIIVPFDVIVSEEDKIPEIAEKIVGDKETMDMIVSWAIEGLHRLIDNNWEFTEGNTIKQAKIDFEMENNSVKRFINNYCSLDKREGDRGFIKTTEFRKVYEAFCESEKIRSFSGKKIKSTLDSMGIEKKKNTYTAGNYYADISFLESIKEFCNTYHLESTIDPIFED